MTVKEYILDNVEESNGNIWVCPHTHSSMRIVPEIWEYGMGFKGVSNIPTEILNAKFRKGWIEKQEGSPMGGTLCVIWENWRVEKDESKMG